MELTDIWTSKSLTHLIKAWFDHLISVTVPISIRTRLVSVVTEKMTPLSDPVLLGWQTG